MSRARSIFLVLVSFGCQATAASAQLGPDGTPINTSNYSVDLTRGAVISTSRVVGLSGAATSLAQGVEGGLQNPSAVAYRGPQWPEWYDYWLALGFSYPFEAGDFYNSGRVVGSGQDLSGDTFFVIPGVYFQMWHLGIGLTIDSQFITVRGSNRDTNDEGDVRLRFTTFHVQAGYGFLEGQLVLGAGLRIFRQRSFVSQNLFSSGDQYNALGLGAEVGIMIKPHHRRWSLGASVFPRLKTGLRERGSVTVTTEGDIVVGDFFVPRTTVLPTTGSVGFSYQFGPRPSNPPWIGEERLAAPELERLDRQKEKAKRKERAEIAEARARGGPDVRRNVRAIEQKYARKYAEINRRRREMRRYAWKVLRKRYRRDWPRRYYLLTSDLWITGRVPGGVGVESFLFQTVQRSGRTVTVSPRLGFETEVWPARMKLRAGTYLEPSRFAQSSARVHGTFGFDVNLFKWSVFGLWPDDYRWQITAALDVSRAYLAFSFGIGGWY